MLLWSCCDGAQSVVVSCCVRWPVWLTSQHHACVSLNIDVVTTDGSFVFSSNKLKWTIIHFMLQNAIKFNWWLFEVRIKGCLIYIKLAKILNYSSSCIYSSANSIKIIFIHKAWRRLSEAIFKLTTVQKYINILKPVQPAFLHCCKSSFLTWFFFSVEHFKEIRMKQPVH